MSSTNSPQTIAVLEFQDELSALLNLRDAKDFHSNKTLVIAGEPEVQIQCKQSKIPFETTLPYFGRAGHEQCLEKSKHCSDLFRPIFQIKDDLGICEGYGNTAVFFFRFFLHHVLMHIEVLHQLAIQHKPGEIMAPSPRYQVHGYKVTRDTRLLGALAGEYARVHGLRHNSLETSAYPASTQKQSSTLKNTAASMLFPFLVRMLGIKKRNRIISLSPDRSYGLPGLVKKWQQYDPSYLPGFIFTQSKDFLKNIYRKDVFSFGSLPIRPASKSFLNQISLHTNRLTQLLDGKTSALTFHGVDMSPFIRSFWEKGLIPLLLELQGRAQSLHFLITKCKPTFVIAQHARGMSFLLGEMAKQKNIPGLLVSHGSHVPLKNRFEEMEWGEHGQGLMNTSYSHLAVQTPWARQYLDHFPSSSKTLCTGPLIFANPSRTKETKASIRNRLYPGVKDKKIVLHAGTPKTRRSRRFYVYETMDEYIGHIRDIIHSLSNFHDIHLAVRYRPVDGLAAEDFQKLLPDERNYSIQTGGGFDEHLLASDLLVSYSSTTIEEALQNQIPVLLYDSQGKYSHLPCQKLKADVTPEISGAFFIGSRQDLPWGLSWLYDNVLGKKLPEQVWEPHRFHPSEIMDKKTLYQTIAHSNRL